MPQAIYTGRLTFSLTTSGFRFWRERWQAAGSGCSFQIWRDRVRISVETYTTGVSTAGLTVW